ncbi:MAG: hypothetical protein V4474_01210 [Patescibacteria group bacterium]
MTDTTRVPFSFEGKNYAFELPANGDTPHNIVLPDLTLLEVDSWVEVLPPVPEGIRRAASQPKIHSQEQGVQYIPGTVAAVEQK